MFSLVAIIIFGVSAVQCVRLETESKREKEANARELTVLAPFRSVQAGRSFVTISDLSLLELLSNDASCVTNLSSVTFSSVVFRDSDVSNLIRLENVVSIGFYDCEKVEAIISNGIGRQVHSVAFESMLISQYSMDLLKEMTSIDVTINGRSIRED